MSAFETEKLHGYTLKIYYDDAPDNPLQYDNFTTAFYIPCSPRGYRLGDEGANEEAAAEAPVSAPLYIYYHSGLELSTSPFYDPWDSWRAGTAYITEKKISEIWGNLKRGDALKLARETLKFEVERYADYLAGRVYAYEIEGPHGEILDSLAGYYGEGGIEAIKEDFRMFVEHQLEADYPLLTASGIDPITLEA